MIRGIEVGGKEEVEMEALVHDAYHFYTDPGGDGGPGP